jgi:hypothetical protein
MKVYCSYHDQWGHCNEGDYNDAKNGNSPSRTVRVHFETFTHSVPFHTLSLLEEIESDMDDDEKSIS